MDPGGTLWEPSGDPETFWVDSGGPWSDPGGTWGDSKDSRNTPGDPPWIDEGFPSDPRNLPHLPGASHENPGSVP